MKINVKQKADMTVIRVVPGNDDALLDKEYNLLKAGRIKFLFRPELVKKSLFRTKQSLVYIAPKGTSLIDYFRTNAVAKDRFYRMVAQVVSIFDNLSLNSLTESRLLLDMRYVYFNVITEELHFIYLPYLTSFYSTDILSFFKTVVNSVRPQGNYLMDFSQFVAGRRSFLVSEFSAFLREQGKTFANYFEKINAGHSGYTGAITTHPGRGAMPGMGQGMTPGMSPVINRPMDPGMGNGVNPPMNRPMDPGMGNGMSPPMNRPMDPGMGNGMSPPINRPMNSGMGNGMNPPMNRPMNSGMGNGMSPPMNRPMNSGMGNGMDPGMASGGFFNDYPNINSYRPAGSAPDRPSGGSSEEGTTLLSGGGFSDEGTTLLDNDEGTMLLGQDSAPVYTPHSYIRRLSGGQSVEITKPIFRIGRAEYSDYVLSDNRAVGRDHAEIIMRNGKYYIKDLGTVNHTYVNNSVISPNMETEIFDGTIVRLANEEFEFSIR